MTTEEILNALRNAYRQELFLEIELNKTTKEINELKIKLQNIYK